LTRGISQQTHIKLHSSGDAEGREGVLYNLRVLMQVDKSLQAPRKYKSPVCVGPSERAPWRPAAAPTGGHALPWGGGAPWTTGWGSAVRLLLGRDTLHKTGEGRTHSRQDKHGSSG